ncbi:hypothetical protein [Streptomyces sp. NPDC001536]|uniref:hypothetical protein n=1 Tax=Streptomyces sp. NPDC001536 TaxID=3364583 RepID=UPI00369F5FDC
MGRVHARAIGEVVPDQGLVPGLVVVEEFLAEGVAADVLPQEAMRKPWLVDCMQSPLSGIQTPLCRTQSTGVLDMPGHTPPGARLTPHPFQPQRHIPVGPFHAGQQPGRADAVRRPDLGQSGRVHIGLAPPVVPVPGVVGGGPATAGLLGTGEHLQYGGTVARVDGPDAAGDAVPGVVGERFQTGRAGEGAEDVTGLGVYDIGVSGHPPRLGRAAGDTITFGHTEPVREVDKRGPRPVPGVPSTA